MRVLKKDMPVPRLRGTKDKVLKLLWNRKQYDLYGKVEEEGILPAGTELDGELYSLLEIFLKARPDFLTGEEAPEWTKIPPRPKKTLEEVFRERYPERVVEVEGVYVKRYVSGDTFPAPVPDDPDYDYIITEIDWDRTIRKLGYSDYHIHLWVLMGWDPEEEGNPERDAEEAYRAGVYLLIDKRSGKKVWARR